jgi:signal transduction histidine kinase
MHQHGINALAAGVLLITGALAEESRLTIEAWVDSTPHAVNPNKVLRLAPGPHRLDFRFGPAVRADSFRLRFKLEGLDNEWRDAQGLMRVTARFSNAAGDVVENRDFEVRGNSAGWTGSPERSRLTSRRETVTVPENAVTLRLLLVSGGPVETVGTLIVDDLKVSAVERGTILIQDDFETNEQFDRPDETPRGWLRGGLRRDLLQVARFGGNHALAAFDANVQSFGEWFKDVPLHGQVQPGEKLTLEWKEMFSVGKGGSNMAGYGYVPPGDYVFRVQALAPLEDRVIGAVALAVEVPTPFWKSAWFLMLCTTGGAVGVALAARQVTRRRWQRRVERLEGQQAVERERTRIARDIHDDLGTNLTRIGLLSQMIRRETADGSRAAAAAEEVGQAARAMTQAMAEIVWAVNPHYDTLEGLANFLGRFAQEFLSTAGLRCRLDLPLDLPAIPLAAEKRHQLFLAFKEALNNIVRHARATEVRIALTVEADRFRLTMSDDGCGFSIGPTTSHGNGLTNMAVRLKEIGGACEIESQPGRGTTVRLSVPGGGGNQT